MENNVVQQLRQALRRHLAPRRHTALLIAIVALFMVRPLIGDGGLATAVFSIALLILLLFALYAIQVDELVGEREVLLAQRRRRSIIGWALAVPAIAERLAMILMPSPILYLSGTILWLLLFIFITWNQLRGVLRQKEITGETISMAISVYLLLGFTCGLFFIVLHHLQPLAFNFGNPPAPDAGADEQRIFPVLIYFSLTTLSTIGFGDITPVTLQARYAAVAEGIAGQFYLAILVARLVGLQMSKPSNPQNGNQSRNSETEDQQK
jgi:voltage-gated potassium channel